ncbi:MAG: aldo/keto reductase [Sutterellaceae bacterium]|nr:aldo/keto reductase [Burkholderiaceae bacterium]MDW8430006.1 aldo/keto reductase [Sutterellaceae bacterium]
MNRTVLLRDGRPAPALGLGTWRLGESSRTRRDEVAAVRAALALGYRLIDTAEMYGEGGAEEIVGQAVREAIAAGEVRRQDLFLVSKVYPHHASRRGVQQACARSLQRLGVEYLDLYLLHWRGSHPLAETVAGFEALRERGLIRAWGVSNFDVADLQALLAAPGGDRCAANQVYYSVTRRGIEFDLLPWQRARGMPLMAYCPIDQGAAAADPTLAAIGRRVGASAAQVALAFVLRQPDVIAIPKAVRKAHLRENLAALSVVLDADAWAALDRRFPPPSRKQALAIV